QDHRGEGSDGTEVARNGRTDIQTQNPAAPVDLKSDFALERATAVRDQVVAGIHAPVIHESRAIGTDIDRRLPGIVHRALGYFDFRTLRSPREVFDGMAVGIARGEIHCAKIAAVA